MNQTDRTAVATMVRDRVTAEYGLDDKWIPTPDQIQVFLETKAAVNDYVEDIAVNIAHGTGMLSLNEYGTPYGTRPVLEGIEHHEIVLRYYAGTAGRTDDFPSYLRIPLADVLPEYAQYKAVVDAIS